MKKFALLLMIFCLFASVGCTVADKSLSCIGNLTFCEVNGGLAIVKCKGADSVLYIPAAVDGKPVVEIADNAFREKRYLTEVIVCGNNLKKIGNGAFAGNKRLKSISGLNAVEQIGSYAFASLVQLKEINISGTLTEIPQNAFSCCESIQSVSLPQSVRKICTSAFEGCAVLERVLGAENVETVEQYAFSMCAALKELAVPKTTVCESGSFNNCPMKERMNVAQKDDNMIVVGSSKMYKTFFDDFDGSDIDASKWVRCPEWSRQLGYWHDENSFTDGNGNLVLSVSVGEDGSLYSGAVRSLGKFSQAYGRFEARCKLGNEQGYWGAFWLMPAQGSSMSNENNDDSSADGCEIDIFESPYFSTQSVNFAVHWDGYGENHKSTSQQFSQNYLYYGYHTFTLDWAEGEYIFYIDGNECWKTAAAGISSAAAYMKLTTEIGTWGGMLDTRLCPLKALMVDNVSVWQYENKQ